MPKAIFYYVEKIFHDAYFAYKDPDDAYQLGKLYYYQRYGNVDFEKAVKYLTLVSQTNAGYGPTEELLGICYYNGEGIEADYQKALHLLIKGALYGSFVSLYSLYYIGDIYREGYYV